MKPSEKIYLHARNINTDNCSLTIVGMLRLFACLIIYLYSNCVSVCVLCICHDENVVYECAEATLMKQVVLH